MYRSDDTCFHLFRPVRPPVRGPVPHLLLTCFVGSRLSIKILTSSDILRKLRKAEREKTPLCILCGEPCRAGGRATVEIQSKQWLFAPGGHQIGGALNIISRISVLVRRDQKPGPSICMHITRELRRANLL